MPIYPTPNAVVSHYDRESDSLAAHFLDRTAAGVTPEVTPCGGGTLVVGADATGPVWVRLERTAAVHGTDWRASPARTTLPPPLVEAIDRWFLTRP